MHLSFLAHKFSRLARIQRITLILFVVLVTGELVAWTTGSTVLGGDLPILLWIVFAVLLSFMLLQPVTRRMVWRVRNRLLVTYFLVGVLPTLLILTMVIISVFALLGAMVSYLCRSELDRQLGQLQQTARQRAAGTHPTAPENVAGQAIIRAGNRTVPHQGPIADIPSWSKPGFSGIVRANASSYFMAAHVETGTNADRVEVLAYRPFDDEVLAQLIEGFGMAVLIRDEDIRGSGEQSDGEFKAILDSSRAVHAPKPRSIWDIGAMAAVPLDVRSLDTGSPDPHFIASYSQPAVVFRRLSGGLGSLGPAALISFLVLAGAFLLVELIALVSSAQLTRALTRSVHDIYTGTKTIESGDFSRRIPIRGKDQLSELAQSFNGMTERVERLIVEVKEKEKLESELEIARQVQAQLFPKVVPKLRTLELAGLCKPARVVSGDYYDFIPLDSPLTALVLGDISGKGISAALVMASIQSSLHAQLTLGTDGPASTARLVGRLNRQIYENTPLEKYATFFCGIYDDQTGNLRYTNAGHLPLVLLRRRTVSRLESNGTVVGMFPDAPYEQDTVTLQPGDLLVAYTDGITESEDGSGQQFGEERLTELLIQHCDRPLDEIAQIVTARVQDWAYDLDNQDDTTILLARRL